MRLNEDNTLQTYEGVEFDCRKCNRRLHLSFIITGYECQCGLEYTGVEVIEGDGDD